MSYPALKNNNNTEKGKTYPFISTPVSYDNSYEKTKTKTILRKTKTKHKTQK